MKKCRKYGAFFVIFCCYGFFAIIFLLLILCGDMKMGNYITNVLLWFVSIVTLLLTYIGFYNHPLWGILFGGAAVISNPIFHRLIRNKKPLRKLLCLLPAFVLTALFLTACPMQPSDAGIPPAADTADVTAAETDGDISASGGSDMAADDSISASGGPDTAADDSIPASGGSDTAADDSIPASGGSDTAADNDSGSPAAAPTFADTSADAAASESAVPLSVSTSDPGEPAELNVHYIDVGQGDATLVTCGGHSMLIDTGDNNKGTTVQLYLTKQGIDHLDYLVLTHSDADHIGGADVIISKFNIDRIFFSNYEQDTKTYRELMDAMADKGKDYTTPAAGETYRLGDASFTILGPLKNYDTPNNSSIALMIAHGAKRFLFTGDCGETAEADLAASGQNLSADVYQTGHHGSRTSSTQKLMDAVKPAYAVISCGEDNSYGHPHAETLNRFRSMGIQVFRTDEQGSIVAVSDGSSIRWNCAPSETWQAGEPKGSSSSTDSTDMAAEPNTAAAEAADSNDTGRYIGNKNNGKLHLSTCGHLPYPENREYFDTREAAVAAGYNDPCKLCNP